MERISALMDGELEGQEAQSAMLRLLSEADVRSGWAQYHLISDALHNEYRLSSDFAKQVSARLVEEPTVLAPRPRSRLLYQARKHALSMAASVAAVAVVGWFAWSNGPLSPDSGSMNLASNTSHAQLGTSAAPAAPQLVSMDGNVRAYLLAHQEYSPTTQIQGVAPYVRTVAESPADGAR